MGAERTEYFAVTEVDGEMVAVGLYDAHSDLEAKAEARWFSDHGTVDVFLQKQRPGEDYDTCPYIAVLPVGESSEWLATDPDGVVIKHGGKRANSGRKSKNLSTVSARVSQEAKAKAQELAAKRGVSVHAIYSEILERYLSQLFELGAE